MADPAHRHGGPDAGWYIPDGHGWQRISDGEAGDHGDAAHFMSDPNGRHWLVADGLIMCSPELIADEIAW